MEKSCFYNRSGMLSNERPFSCTGKCFGFTSHTFDGVVKAAAIIEDDKSGLIVIVEADHVRFCNPGNLDKR